ncbi:MAG: nitroreductase [Nonlabens sp.]
MKLSTAIKTRRSIFPVDYIPGNVLPDDLVEILESSRWAPTHKKTEPWRYKVIQGEARTRLGDFMMAQFEENEGKPAGIKLRKQKEKMQASAAIILIFMNRDSKERIPEWEEIAAVSMSVQNMWLTAHSLGYGAYWSSPKSYAHMKKFESIQVGENEKFLGFFYIGNHSIREMPTVERQGIDHFVQFVK